jgi:hypothetical protein
MTTINPLPEFNNENLLLALSGTAGTPHGKRLQSVAPGYLVGRGGPTPKLNKLGEAMRPACRCPRSLIILLLMYATGSRIWHRDRAGTPR